MNRTMVVGLGWAVGGLVAGMLLTQGHAQGQTTGAALPTQGREVPLPVSDATAMVSDDDYLYIVRGMTLYKVHKGSMSIYVKLALPPATVRHAN